MDDGKMELRKVRVADEVMFRAAVREFREHDPHWLFAFEYDDAEPFASYVERLEYWSRGENLPEGLVPATYLIGSVGDTIVGRVSIRHILNDYLARIGGHVGYGVSPSHRRRGYGTKILRQALPIAAGLGIRRLLVTCDVGNIGSQRIVESNGGVFDGLIEDAELDIPKRRYWIDIENPE